MLIKIFVARLFSKYIARKNIRWIKKPLLAQDTVFQTLVNTAKNTSFGKDHSFEKITSYELWKKNVPIRNYEGIKKYIDKVISGEENVLWPGKPLYFSKTSGTTSGAKYIPITKASMPNHIRAARDAILCYIYETKNTSIINGKMIFLQGSPKLYRTGGVLTGRLSGIVAHHIPFYLKRNRLPSYRVNCISDWEQKVDAIVEETINQNMTVIGGIPPWVKMYFEKLQKKTNCAIKDVFKNFEVFIYGGVNFAPYKNSFEELIGKKVSGIEFYPASEGFIAYQDSQKEEGLLLCVDHGIFYEFIPSEEFFNKNPSRICLADVEVNKDYVIILNTNAGLWGYNIGDTVKFVSTSPYRILVTGRIAHFTSAFGEHVIAQEVEKSLVQTINKHNAIVVDFHVAPQVNPLEGLPFHEWFIEFDSPPKNISLFENSLDLALQNLNTYYKDLVSGGVLGKLKVTRVEKNGFIKYMKSVGKLGGQNKTPRLSNNRDIAEKLNKFK